jgi:formiminotetrahydrofolate cyclodeaminase
VPGVTVAETTLSELLEQIAARTPAPAGGTAAALAGATAAALVEMAAGVALRSPAAELRALLLELAERDTRSYAPVLEARRPDERARALVSAAETPAAIAKAAAEVAELAAAVSNDPGNELLAGDIAVAAMLAEAAVRSATALVELNLRAAAGEQRP